MTIGVEMTFSVPGTDENHHVKLDAASIAVVDPTAVWKDGEPPKVCMAVSLIALLLFFTFSDKYYRNS